MTVFQDTVPYYGQDPFVFRHKGQYLIALAEDEKRITLGAFGRYNLKRTTIWDSPSEFQVWAPEIHQIGNHYYVFYTASKGTNDTHRNYVLQSHSNNPFGPYYQTGPFGPDIWGIDLTAFQHNNHWYAVWSGWENPGDGFPQHLYISTLENPNQRTKLASPQLPWEISHVPVLEGPQAYTANNRLHLFYAANASWTQDYATGVLSLNEGNPLNPENWSKRQIPLFTNCGHGHHIPGTNEFVAHRKLSHIHGWQDREIFTQKLITL